MLFGFLFLFLILFGQGNLFGQNRTVTNTPNIRIVQG